MQNKRERERGEAERGVNGFSSKRPAVRKNSSFTRYRPKRWEPKPAGDVAV